MYAEVRRWFLFGRRVVTDYSEVVRVAALPKIARPGDRLQLNGDRTVVGVFRNGNRILPRPTDDIADSLINSHSI